MRVAQRLHAPDHVLRRHRLAVVKARLGAQAVDHHGTVLGVPDGAGDKAVFGRWFVERGGQQSIVLRGGSHFALEGIGIEAVERADNAEAHAASFGGGRIDVIEMLEVRAVFYVLEQRQRMAEFAVFGVRELDADNAGGRHEARELEERAAVQGHRRNVSGHET